MKIVFTLITLALCAGNLTAQEIYTRSFGVQTNEAILFLHGGPGYNCASFEATTAQQLADSGFYVIVYDRRGEGRSLDSNAQFTFSETFDDINNIYLEYGIEKATLMGHSFGGMIATLYAKKYPENVKSIVLVSAPVALQETYKTILKTSSEIYQERKDDVNLRYVQLLRNMDSSSLEFSTYCFAHAMQNGFYSPKKPNQEALSVYATFLSDTLLVKYASNMSIDAPQGYWKNEHYTTLDLTLDLVKLVDNDVHIFALYGQEDGLYSSSQIMNLTHIIGAESLFYFENCSHSIFIDQRSLFLQAVTNWMKP